MFAKLTNNALYKSGFSSLHCFITYICRISDCRCVQHLLLTPFLFSVVMSRLISKVSFISTKREIKLNQNSIKHFAR